MILGCALLLCLSLAAAGAPVREMTLSADGGKILTGDGDTDMLQLEGNVKLSFGNGTLDSATAVIEVRRSALNGEAMGLENLERAEFTRGVLLQLGDNRFTSDSAEADFDQDRYDLIGSVSGNWEDYRFWAQHFRFDQASRNIVARGEVRLEFFGHGIGFLDPGEETEKPLEVRCSRLEYRRDSGEVEFWGSRSEEAAIVSGNLRMTADSFALLVDRGERRLLRLDGDGNVQIEAPSFSASSRRISLDPARESIVLRENVRYVSGGIFEQHVERAEIVRVGKEYILNTFADERDVPEETPEVTESDRDGDGSDDGTES